MYHVDITNTGEYLFKVRSRDYEFNIDTKGKGINPPDALLGSLGACVGVYLRKYAESAKLALESFTITVSGELSPESPVSFRTIDITLDLQGLVMDERRKKALLDFVHNCPVHNTLKANPQVNIRIL